MPFQFTPIAQADVDAKVADAINDSTTIIAPSQNAVFDALALKQSLDADLTTLAGLTATTDNFVVAVSSAWASRTPAQAKTALALVKADVGLGSVDNTSDAGKPVSTATQTALDLKANLSGPTFTGVPAAPTAAVDTNTTQVATTAFVVAQAGASNPVMDGSVAVGTSKRYSREDHVHASDTSRAPLASPTLTGTPAAPTAAVDTNTTQVATTAFVVAQAGASNPVMDGAVTVGTSKRYSREDHVHASDTSRQATLVSATNIKTVNGSTLLGSGDLVVTGSAATFNPNLQTSAADQTIPALSSVFLFRKYLLTGTAKQTNHGFLICKN